MFRNIETVKHNYKGPKLLGGWLLLILKISEIILNSSINQCKKFMTSKNQNVTLINNNS